MQNCKPISTPLVQNAKLTKNDGAALIDQNKYRNLIGCLLYLSTTRPDIMFVVSLLSRFMHSPSELHFKETKRVLRYVKGTTSYEVAFFSTKKPNNEAILMGYCDSVVFGILFTYFRVEF